MIISFFRGRMGHTPRPQPLPLSVLLHDPLSGLPLPPLSHQEPSALRSPAEVRAYWEGLRN